MKKVSNPWKAARKKCPILGQRDRSGSGFTLVELLVVMAIMGLLAALVFPALRNAHQASLRAACMSNVRQLAMANHAYAADAGVFVAAASDVWGKNLHRWHGARTSSKQPFDSAQGPLSEYLGENGLVKQCPSFRPTEAGFEAGCGGYGYNAAGVGSQSYLSGTMNGSTVGARPEMIAQPEATVMFADAAYLSSRRGKTALTEYSFVEPYMLLADTQPVEAYPAQPTMHFRHNGYANVVWVDGHVTQEKLQHSYSQAHKNAQLGWFGPKDNSLFDPF